METVKVIINRSEITAGTRGASLGPDAIKTASRSKHSTFFQEFEPVEIENYNYLLDHPTKYIFAKRIDGLVKVYDQLNEVVSETILKGELPFLLAGDHGSAGGTIAGIASALPKARIGVVWIDAHADIHTPFTTPSGNLHGMPLATALAIDNKVCQINEVDEETVRLWEQLKKTGIDRTKINASDLVYIAVRDTEPEEDHVMKELGLRNIEVSEVHEKGVEAIVKEVLRQLSVCDVIYISFDVDSMDPELTSYGTGTPVKNGLTPEEAAGLLEGLASSPKTVCVEFVEVNPCLDEKKNKMAEVAFSLMERTVSAIVNR